MSFAFLPGNHAGGLYARRFPRGLLVLAVIAIAGCGQDARSEVRTPLVDHHTHLISPTALAFLQNVAGLPSDMQPFIADDLIPVLDSAGINRSMLASVAYFYASSLLPEPIADERAQVENENDWNVHQAAQYDGRFIVFCGVNPLSSYAKDEVVRCGNLPNVRGIKMHFDNSGVDLLNPSHVTALRAVFRTINDHGLAILVHLRVSSGNYGSEHSRIFIERVLESAPDVSIQIAHLAGSGPGYDADDAFLVFAQAAARGDQRLAKVYFDVASSVTEDATKETLDLVAERLRMAGFHRILFGSDYAGFMNEPPYAAWDAFSRLPLTAGELRRIATNTAPYMQ